MAKKKAKRNGDGWREQSVIVKKTHPFARSKEEAVLVAERHVKSLSRGVAATNGTFRVGIRPKTCFQKFRGQRRGPHVTVYWGKLVASMKTRPECK